MASATGKMAIPKAVEFILFGLITLLVLAPFAAILWKGTNLRRFLWRLGCWRWVICCDRFYGEGVNRVDLMESGGGAQTVHAHYQLMLGRPRQPAPAHTLRLATWREHLRLSRPNVLAAKLEEIHIHIIPDETMQRMDPPVVPTPIYYDATIATKQDSHSSLQQDRNVRPVRNEPAAKHARRIQEEQPKGNVENDEKEGKTESCNIDSESIIHRV